MPEKPDRRISAALSLAGRMKEEGQHREAQIVADLCHSASAQRALAQKQYRDLMRFRELLKTARLYLKQLRSLDRAELAAAIEDALR